jgi:hypothetical protein
MNKKDYYLQMNIGHAKYVVNYCDGVKTHKDGSRFYDMAIFRNKNKTNAFIKELSDKGYKERRNYYEEIS